MCDKLLKDLDNLLSNRRRLRELLKVEKDRRGLEEDKLVFIGMANIAGYWWCARKSILRSRNMEIEFFKSYLEDRIKYSIKLGYFNGDKLPRRREKILSIGNEITMRDIEKLLKEWDKLFEEEKDICEKNRIINIIKTHQDVWEFMPDKLGTLCQLGFAERYPTIRWNFEWKDYVIVGVPDGITDEFIYEFKITKSEFLMKYTKPVAFTQADLYGYFFKRNIKRIQILIRETWEIRTWMEKVDVNNAKETLCKFRNLEENLEKPISPQKWKCNKCEYRDICRIYTDKASTHFWNYYSQ